METFVRWCALLIEVLVKAYGFFACFYFGSFAFRNYSWSLSFSPHLLPMTATCLAFAFLVAGPRRWMPTRWLQDVSFRRMGCVVLGLCTPLSFAVVDFCSGELSPAFFLEQMDEVLPVVFLLPALLAARWWAVESPRCPCLMLRFWLLPIALWLALNGIMGLFLGRELVWFYYLMVPSVAAGIAFTFWRAQARGVEAVSKAE